MQFLVFQVIIALKDHIYILPLHYQVMLVLLVHLTQTLELVLLVIAWIVLRAICAQQLALLTQ